MESGDRWWIMLWEERDIVCKFDEKWGEMQESENISEKVMGSIAFVITFL